MSESPRVFISHIHSDSDWVRSFVDQLLSAGQENVWCFEREVAVGEPWADKVENGLRSSEYIVLVVSPGSINSSWFNFELGASLGMGKKVIPIVDKELKAGDLPGPLRSMRYIQMDSPEDAAREVVHTLEGTEKSAST